MKRLGYLVIVFVVIFLAIFTTKKLILGGNAYVQLASAQPLSGVAAQNMDEVGGSVTLPVAGTDFKLTGVKYFDNNSWAVATILPTKNNITGGVIVLEKTSGIYQVVLGPGTAFDQSYLLSMPTDIGQYLGSQGVIYESTYK